MFFIVQKCTRGGTLCLLLTVAMGYASGSGMASIPEYSDCANSFLVPLFSIFWCSTTLFKAPTTRERKQPLKVLFSVDKIVHIRTFSVMNGRG